MIFTTENMNIRDTLIKHLMSSFPGTNMATTIPILNRMKISRLTILLNRFGEEDYEIVVNRLL